MAPPNGNPIPPPVIAPTLENLDARAAALERQLGELEARAAGAETTLSTVATRQAEALALVDRIVAAGDAVAQALIDHESAPTHAWRGGRATTSGQDLRLALADLRAVAARANPTDPET